MLVFLSAFELAIFLARQTMLERAVDVAIRDVRLHTGRTYTQAAIRRTVCERAVILPDCEANLAIEVTRVDRSTYEMPDPARACASAGGSLTGAGAVNDGTSDDLMVVRTCYRVRPFFPQTGLGFQFAQSEDGRASMVASAVFVQEPADGTAGGPS